jgi:hypothetical protein
MEDRLTDGRRIAELLAAELDGLGGALADVAVRDADRDTTPTADGAYAYRVVLGRGPTTTESDGTATESGTESDGVTDAESGTESDETAGVSEGTELAVVFVHPDRARVEVVTGQDVAAAAADEAGLRVRPKAVRPPRTLVFVEDAAEVKRAVGVFEAVASAVDSGETASEA